MEVYIAAFAAGACFFLGAPARLFWNLEWRQGRALTLGLRFSLADMQKSAERLAFSTDQPWPIANMPDAATLLSRAESAAAALRYILRRDFTRVRLRARVGTGDARSTALVCGALYAACGALRVTVTAEPDYSAARLCLRGMIRVKIGHIVLAALLYIARTERGRVTQWIKNRSKAS